MQAHGAGARCFLEIDTVRQQADDNVILPILKATCDV
jgi:hypothetical protein